jgi:predicted nuclease of predicted toxin-antitoxin system
MIVITTGNIKNKELLSLFSKNIDQIIEFLDICNLIEMDNTDLIGHE